ncbi:MFS transporter [Vibrio sp. PP-XX7]
MPRIGRQCGFSSDDINSLLSWICSWSVVAWTASDSFGRRPIMLVGIVLFGIVALICAHVTQIETLSYLRAAQEFAGAAAAVVIQAVVRDMFEREDFSRVMSFITMVIIIAPLIAPMLGLFGDMVRMAIYFLAVGYFYSDCDWSGVMVDS